MTRPLFVSGRAGRIHPYRQQSTEAARPYTSCRIVVLMDELEYAGITFPDPTRFLETFRRRTGVAEIAANGSTQGTSATDIVDTMRKMMPWVEVVFRGFPEDWLLEQLDRGAITLEVACSYKYLPAALRTFSPNFRGTHAIWISQARKSGGTWEVKWVDCLGPEGWQGKWVKWSVARAALKATGTYVNGRQYGIAIAKGAGLYTFVRPSAVAPAVAKVPKGTQAFVEDAQQGNLVGAKPITKTQTFRSTAVMHISQYPKRPPTGDFVGPIPSGPDAGKYVRLGSVTLTPEATPDVQEQIDAATKPLKDRITELENGMDNAMADLVGART